MRIVLLLLLFFNIILANQRLIISKFENLKPYYYNHQIVHLKLKTITAESGVLDIEDDLNISTINTINEGDDYITDISFKLNGEFPKFYIKLTKDNQLLDEETIKVDSQLRHLYPPKNFCHVLANNLVVKDTILSVYDNNYNIIYFTILANNGNAEDFSLGYEDEKLYLISEMNNTAIYSYSAIVPKNKRRFNFLYFNLTNESYKDINFIAQLKDERVSTQTDIKPLDTSHLILRDIVGGALIILFLIIYVYRRRIIYLIFVLLITGYVLYINIPKADITLKEGTVVRLLPFKNSTTLFVASYPMKVKVLKEKDGWKKIDFKNQIGWVKDE